MEDFSIGNVINDVIQNFDFAYMLTVNIATYLIIKLIDILNGCNKVTFWQKRLVLVICIVILGSSYYVSGYDSIIKLINSSVAAPVFWSWILKPFCIKLNIDYKQIDECMK